MKLIRFLWTVRRLWPAVLADLKALRADLSSARLTFDYATQRVGQVEKRCDALDHWRHATARQLDGVIDNTNTLPALRRRLDEMACCINTFEARLKDMQSRDIDLAKRLDNLALSLAKLAQGEMGLPKTNLQNLDRASDVILKQAQGIADLFKEVRSTKAQLREQGRMLERAHLLANRALNVAGLPWWKRWRQV